MRTKLQWGKTKVRGQAHLPDLELIEGVVESYLIFISGKTSERVGHLEVRKVGLPRSGW